MGGGRPHTGQHVARATSFLLQRSTVATNANPLLELSPPTNLLLCLSFDSHEQIMNFEY